MNPYTVLGVAPSAEEAEIKRAHRALAATLHPDRAGGDAQRMAEVNVAYTLLTDPARRARYDAEHRVADIKCPRCAGTGYVLKQKGFKTKVRAVCSACDGKGVRS